MSFRSAITGRFVKMATALRWPKQTVEEQPEPKKKPHRKKRR